MNQCRRKVVCRPTTFSAENLHPTARLSGPRMRRSARSPSDTRQRHLPAADGESAPSSIDSRCTLVSASPPFRLNSEHVASHSRWKRGVTTAACVGSLEPARKRWKRPDGRGNRMQRWIAGRPVDSAWFVVMFFVRHLTPKNEVLIDRPRTAALCDSNCDCRRHSINESPRVDCRRFSHQVESSRMTGNSGSGLIAACACAVDRFCDYCI
jgi:hypothetical protein